MAFFTTKVDEKSISESDFEYIKQSGIYDCKIKFVSVKVNTHGARSLDFNVEYKGSSLTLYGLKLDNNDGSENFQRKTFNKLCIIAGLESIDDPIERVHVVGKEKKEQNSIETKYGEVPESLAQFEVAYFSGVGIFQDIIDNKFDHNELLTTEDTDVLLGAIEHYFEYDDFQD